MNLQSRIARSVRVIMIAWILARSSFTASGSTLPDEPSSGVDHRDDHFERHIRPLLLSRCVECHGPDSQEAGLRLDTREGFLKGGDSGLLLDAKVPEAGRLLNAIRYDDDLRMPPDGKLPAHELQMLEAWIVGGAAWPAASVSDPSSPPNAPANEGKTNRQAGLNDGRSHWSFQPVQRPVVPESSESAAAAWCHTEVDAFILRSLLDAGLQPSPIADRRTLIRRATADLHGLVPTPEEVREFEADPRADAFQHLVDRLLESPRYGERWARYWLDVARYSDTRGYVRLKENPVYPSAWTYRDYVIDALNRDLPWDRFIIEQLAADTDPDTNDPKDLAALGFLTLGQRFINSQNDIIDDRIDVVTRGFLGLTVTCARCHDHKYDPVSMDDYYGLHGIFASSREPDYPALILPESSATEYSAYLTELQRREAAFRVFLMEQQQKLESMFRGRTAEYLMAARTEKVQANFLPVMFLIDASKDLNPVVIQRWARLLQRTRSENHPILEPWHRLSRITAEDEHSFKEAAASVVGEIESEIAAGTLKISPPVLDAIRVPMKSLREVADRYQMLQDDSVNAPNDDQDWQQIKAFFIGADAPSTVALDDVDEFMFADASTQNVYHEQQRIVEDWIAQPHAAPHAHVLQESPEPHDSPIFLRGNASNPGRVVPRQFLRVIAQPHSDRYVHGSGRYELARDIASPQNPLTARVAVNRIWLHHFGTGLVPTAGDFGTRGELPVHRELLDYLAAEFVQQGWSVKTIHQLIMNSAVYQQTSDARHEALSVDPENMRYWRMNRRRMDWETMRDSLLYVSGDLDLKMGGPSEPLFAAAGSKRRSVYGFVDRQALPSILRTFDFATPEQSAPQRHQTSVPQQALFLMNSGFMRDRAVAMARRIELDVRWDSKEALQKETAEQLADRACWLAYGRSPQADERESMVEFLLRDAVESLKSEGDAEPRLAFGSLEELCHVLLMSNEFQFVD